MYLEKLTLSGFKSFADRSEMTFDSGISAIVGPNGSGKSNITDAIRWVLGEQSTKSLRGKKMEDIIFSGTETKSPKNFAEVSLVLDNTSGFIKDQLDEIAISRRLFRSGDSEYRMNGKICKLRDIHELFMDTGLGKNGYSLVGQGGIESIISASPLELRGIVEEAVGIVNYKTKKQEAEKKLANTQNNIERLSDILDEIEKQIKPLKRQSEKAKEYLKIRDELKKVDLVIFHKDMIHAKDELSEITKNLTGIDDEINLRQKAVDKKDEDYQQARSKIQHISEKISDLEETLTELRLTISEAEKRKITLNANRDHEKQTQSRLDVEYDKNKEENEAFAKELAKLQSEKDDFEEAWQLKSNETQDRKRQKNKLLGDMEIEKIKQAEGISLIEKRDERLKTLNEEFLTLQTTLTKYSTEKGFREKQYAELDVQLQEAKNQLEDCITEGRENDKLSEKLKKEQAHQTEIINANNEKIKQLVGQINLTDNNAKVNLSKRDYLKNLQKNYNDYFPSIRAVMNSRELLDKVFDRVFGPVGELIRIPDKLATAIDVALGARSQNIVVADVNTANACINILKKQKAGRATFLPLSNLKIQTISAADAARIKGMKGCLGIASELVSTAANYENVVRSLLGRVVVAEDFSAAKGLLSAGMGKYTLVTLEGEIFYPGGAIVGGYQRKGNQSPLFKKAEIDKLEAEIRSQTTTINKMRTELEQLETATTGLSEAAKQTSLRVSSLEQERWKISRQEEETRTRIEELTASAKVYSQEEAEEQVRQLKEKLKVNQEETAHIQQLMKASGDDTDERINYIRERIEILTAAIAEDAVELTRHQEGIKSIQSQMTLLESQLLANQKKGETNRGEYRAAGLRLNDATSEGDELSHSIADYTQQSEEKSAELSALKESSKEETALCETLDREIREINHEMTTLKESKSAFDLRRNKIEMQVEHWEKTIYDTYEMNAIMVEDIVDDLLAEDIDTSPERQRELKGRITALGNINVGAIEEYTELNDRYTFMKTQYDDLISAKKEIVSVIENLYTSMETQFATEFKVLQKKFSRIFGILFEGGKAQIDYTDPENVLESGIELSAQPPGKNLRHISLLSGGEKSMIAIALLFSFIELNPTPFCVIDEIDAALDDRNIFRFTEYLKQVAADNQFIIITHRKQTLEACDTIYGVSMAKNGVSKLVSVRLSDYVEPAV